MPPYNPHTSRAARTTVRDAKNTEATPSIGRIQICWIRLLRSAIVLKPSTLMAFHRALVNRKYRLLFAPKRRRKPGPKGPSPDLIAVIVEMKRRNPCFGCRDQFTRRIIGFAVQPGVVDGPALCRMFNQVIAGVPRLPEHLSSDHDPLFQFHRWKANLRILDVCEIKTVPHVPLSHPFVERVIGTVRRELLDHVPFWGVRDLERKLRQFNDYYNHGRVHASLKGVTPICSTDRNVIALDDYQGRSHCSLWPRDAQLATDRLKQGGHCCRVYRLESYRGSPRCRAAPIGRRLYN